MQKPLLGGFNNQLTSPLKPQLRSNVSRDCTEHRPPVDASHACEMTNVQMAALKTTPVPQANGALVPGTPETLSRKRRFAAWADAAINYFNAFDAIPSARIGLEERKANTYLIYVVSLADFVPLPSARSTATESVPFAEPAQACNPKTLRHRIHGRRIIDLEHPM